ncbi:MAG: aspartate-semialdehyde dehydrogenase [Nostocoides sp.]
MTSSGPPDRRPTLAIVGATGAIGQVVLDLLPLRADVWGEVRLAASPDDAGQRRTVLGQQLTVQALSKEFFDGVDVAIFDLPPGLALTWAPIAVARGAHVVDNSPDHRLDPDVPLVVTQVNNDRLDHRPKGIVAVPGSTALTVVEALSCLHERYGLTDVVLTTFQAASGRGRRGLGRLYDEISVVAGNRELGQRAGDVRRLLDVELGPSPFPAPLALNLIPWVGTDAGEGYTSEEVKVRDELRKVLDLPELDVDATCVRVPVAQGHSVSVHARFGQKVVPERARRALLDAPKLVVLDDPDHHEFPTPGDVVGSDPAFVGRVRQPHGRPRVLDFFVCGDNLRSGAAVVLVELAEIIAGVPAR